MFFFHCFLSPLYTIYLVNHDELKQISKKESEEHIDCLRKTERLLSQQQELTETSNKENLLLKEEINNLTCKFDDLNKKSQKQLVEFSIRFVKHFSS